MQPVNSVGITVVDKFLDKNLTQIIDVIRDHHYRLGLNESQIPDIDSMVINLGNFLDEYIISFNGYVSTNLDFSTSIIGHIDEYYPIISNSIRDPEVSTFLNVRFIEMVKNLTLNLNPALHALNDHGYIPATIEKFNINTETSYYVVTGETE